MRLSEIMKESAYKSFRIRYDELINEVKPYEEIIKTYLDKGDYIYRGMQDTGNLIFGDGALLERKSANTKNYVTLMSTFLPSWKGWPRRDKSFICSNTLSNSSGYGKIYYVIPIENQDIAVASAHDFWDSFESLSRYKIYGIYEFNNIIHGMLEYFNVGSPLNQVNSDELINDLTTIQSKMKEMTDEEFNNMEIRQEFLNDFRNTPVVQFLNGLFDPKKNGCKLFNSYKEVPTFDSSREIWMTGKVIFIREDNIDVFLQHYGGKFG
jgi:hypothetical protein